MMMVVSGSSTRSRNNGGVWRSKRERLGSVEVVMMGRRRRRRNDGSWLFLEAEATSTQAAAICGFFKLLFKQL